MAFYSINVTGINNSHWSILEQCEALRKSLNATKIFINVDIDGVKKQANAEVLNEALGYMHCSGFTLASKKKFDTHIVAEIHYSAEVEKDYFIRFLVETLIPDLKESGSTNTASDFQTLVKFLNGAKKARHFTQATFIEYLEKQLIPDMRESGYTATPDDLEKGVNFLKAGVQ